ncbi:AAA domain-containing protein [Saccharopolyspora antimicrobica]|uniref:AAA domain-containing protein n=2 Tax=Saccharopolyspora TaxID=1835 RepID=A0A1I4T3X5_9PSEU|nr:AAA family ATPase [Saccharopolyspora antimicrobica]RKT85882.1 AAA domain-containing protein [Saccharopolyspora antimicrobica]SFM71335.1 AAA domain-containing protein [Saccharopolyspora antimicrobica]
MVANPPPTVRVGRRSLVVLAGLPGAGKSTVLGKLRSDAGISALDSEQVRARLREVLPARLPYRYYRPVVHLAHRSRIAWYCLTTSGPVVAHEPATRATTRAMLVAFGWLSGRQRVLVWLHADPRDALAGQQQRGRLIRRTSFQRHVQRADRMYRRLRGGEVPRGWQQVRLLTRDEAAHGLRLDVRT